MENEATLKYLASVYAKNHPKMHHGNTGCSNNGQSKFFNYEYERLLSWSWLYNVNQPHFPVFLCRQHTGWCDEGGGETQSHGQHEGELDRCLFCSLVVFSLPENDLVPSYRLVSTCHGRISAWTLATAQKSLCTLAAVCSLPLTSWQRCGPTTRSLC